MLAAVGMAFLTPILEAKEFSSAEIGWLNAIKFASVIIFQIWIAAFSDRHAKTVSLKWVMEAMAVVSMAAAGILWLIEDDFIQAALVFILYGATVSCLSPIIDSLSIQYLNHGRNLNYTVARSAGSVTWAFACIGIGKAADICGVNNILLLQIAATILFFVCSRSKFLSKLLKTFDKTFREIFPVFISTKRREKPSAFFDNNFVNNAYFSEAASSSSSHLASSSSKAPISSRMTCLCLWSS